MNPQTENLLSQLLPEEVQAFTYNREIHPDGTVTETIQVQLREERLVFTPPTLWELELEAELRDIRRQSLIDYAALPEGLLKGVVL